MSWPLAIPDEGSALVFDTDPVARERLCRSIRAAGLDPRPGDTVSAVVAALTAAAGESATAVLPALLVVGCDDPDGDGWRLCRQLRSADHPALNRIPLLLVVAGNADSPLARMLADLAAAGIVHCSADDAAFADSVRLLLVREPRREPEVKPSIEATASTAGIAEDAPVGIFRTNSAGQVLSVNAAMARMLGCESPQAALAHYQDLGAQLYLRPERRAEFIRLLQEQGRVENFEYEALTIDGRCIWLCMNAVLAKAEDGQAFVIEGFTIDVTERKQAEAALLASEARYEEVISLISDVIWRYEVDTERRFVSSYISPVADRLLGLPAGTIGNSFEAYFSYVHPEDLPVIQQTFFAALYSLSHHADAEYRLLRPDGTQRWVHSHGAAYLQPNGHLTAIGSTYEITELKTAQVALVESEEKFRSITEQTSDLIALTDAHGIITYASQAAQKLFRCEPALMCGRHFSEFLAESSIPVALPAFAAAMQRGERTDSIELTMRRQDGSEFTGELTGSTFQSSSQLGTLVVIRDITARRQAEQDYQTLFREMLDGFALHEVIWDETGAAVNYRFLAVNPAFERMTGLRAGDIVGRTILEVLPDTERHLIDTYGQVTLTGEPVFFEYYHAGLQKYFEVTAFRPITNQFACIISDITKRRQAEAALRQSEQKFSTAFQTSPYSISISRAADGVFVEVNATFSALTGYTREEVLGRSSIGLGLWCDPADREQVVSDLLAGKAVNGKEIFLRKRNGEKIIGYFSAELIQLDNETCVLSSFNDITDRKRADQEREQLQQQLIQAQKMESVGRLAGGVAHDFNNMLGVILGYTELSLAQVNPTQPLHGNLLEIRQAAKHSADLTRQLLTFARKQSVSPQVLDLNDTVAGMLKMLKRIIGEDIDLDWQPSPGEWLVKVDPSQIDQILVNLCVNARDAIAGVGRITIKTGLANIDQAFCTSHAGFVPGEYVQLTISDDGCGMDQQTLDNLFEPFFTTKQLGQGTGLGLATVYGIIKQNEGCISVNSAPDRGTIFDIYLVRFRGPARQPQTDRPVTPARRGHETVMLVEDEPAILEMTATMLSQQGYRVLTASTPGAALQLAREHTAGIQLLLSDVIMPEMNGRDLARKLQLFHPDLKCLFMSGYTANIISVHGVLDEGVEFLQKPFLIEELNLKIRKVLDSD